MEGETTKTKEFIIKRIKIVANIANTLYNNYVRRTTVE